MRHFWSIIVEPGWVQGAVWKLAEGAAEVLGIGPVTHWDAERDLADAADTSLSGAVQKLAEDVEPTDTVFGVSPTWVAEGQIKREHLDKIRELCDKLTLKPAGFVVLPEAIAHYVKSEESSPLSAVVIGIYAESLDVSVFQLGNLVGTVNVARSVSLVDDVVEGLARFSSLEALPSRILLYDGKEGELAETKASLIEADWETAKTKVKLLHVPKVEIIDTDKKMLAVCLAGASEVGQVANIKVAVASPPGIEVQSTEVAGEVETAAVSQVAGFGMGVDVAARHENRLPSLPTLPSVGNPLPILKSKLMGFLPKFGFLARIRIPKMNFYFPLVGIVVLMLVFFGAWWLFPKAEATIYLTSKKIEEATSLTVGTGGSEARLIEVEVSGEKSKSTTGTKTVGEKAKGEVTMYRAGAEVTIAAGTLLKGPSDLAFALDNEVKVASGSAGTPGTAKVRVTAQNIGSEYNLAGGAKFGVGNYPMSDLEAKSETAFSGGTSREITAVSAADLESLEEGLTEELSEKAKEEAEGKLGGDEILVSEVVDEEVGAKSFSHKEGDETGTVKLTMEMSLTWLAMKKAYLFETGEKVLAGEVPEGFVLREDQLDLEFEAIEKEGSSFNLEANFVANLLPEVDVTEIAKKIRGKSLKVASDYLATLPGFVRVEMRLKPRLPGFLGTLPQVAKNITVEVAAER